MENMFNDLPLYQAVISDECDGIEYVALTSKPATQVNWMAFGDTQKFSINDEKRIVTSCLMVCDTPIFRRDNKLGEYYIQYDRDTLRLMAEKMMLDKRTTDVNIEHLEGSAVKDIVLQEIYIKDVKRGIDPIEFNEVPDGSLFATYKINNDVVWDAIKANKFKGFSIEGLFTLERSSDELSEIKEILDMIKKIKRIKH